METIRFNIGHRFAQPYESDYARWRRCLSVNRGVPFGVIGKALLSFTSHTTPVLERLRGLQHIRAEVPAYHSASSYQRQCPQCAQQLYHTDAFALRWITTCPLHHCALSVRCPACHQPWPEIKAIAKRQCPVCGIASATHLLTVSLPAIRATDYAPIGEIYALLARKERDHQLVTFDPTRRYPVYWSDSIWWARLPTEDERYAALLPADYQRRLARQRIPQTVRYLRMTYRSSALHRWGDSPACDARRSGNESRDAPHLMRSEARRRVEHAAVNAVRQWIASVNGRHRLHVDDYRGLTTATLVREASRCPYCAAFSIWLMHLVCAHYGVDHADRTRNYPFLAEAGFPGMCHLGIPVVRIDGKSYRLDPAFVEWFYRRELSIAFVQLLAFLSHWFRACPPQQPIPEGDKPDVPVRYADFFYSDRHSWSETCVSRVCKDRLFLFFEHDEPLHAPHCAAFYPSVSEHAPLQATGPISDRRAVAIACRLIDANDFTMADYEKVFDAITQLLGITQGAEGWRNPTDDACTAATSATSRTQPADAVTPVS
jgi:hypothetical protein